MRVGAADMPRRGEPTDDAAVSEHRGRVVQNWLVAAKRS